MLKKTALSCAASAFTAVPGRDCHQQPSSHNPHNPSTTTPPPPHHHRTPTPPRRRGGGVKSFFGFNCSHCSPLVFY
ncbi:hypothetical protein C5X84_007220 [Klebsiella pneumoniae subsp. pneumoniae]|nr:hypothetical protein C5X84_007220 [Klebsiella pneumoniae subsp. pneumoniae]